MKKITGIKRKSSHGHEYYFRLKRFKIPKVQFLQWPLEADSKGELLCMRFHVKMPNYKNVQKVGFFMLMVTFLSPFHTITGKQNFIHHYARRHPHIKFSIVVQIQPVSLSHTLRITISSHQFF